MSTFKRAVGRGRWSTVIVVSMLSAGVLAACTHPGHRPPHRPTSTSPSTSPPTGGRPVAIVESGTKTLRLTGFGCWTDGLCIDPAPPDIVTDWPDIGDADAVTVTIALPGAGFGARFVPLGQGSGAPGITGTMTRTGPTSWRLQRPASPGSFLAYISGGNTQGDLTYIFRWTVA